MPRKSRKSSSAGRPLAYPARVPSSYFRVNSSPDATSVSVVAREYLGVLHIDPGLSAIELPVSPKTMPGRIGIYAQLYERFKFKKLTFFYQPIVAATEPGSFVVAYDVDYDDDTPTGVGAIARLLANQSAAVLSVNAPANMPLKLDLTVPYMYTTVESDSYEGRTDFQGRLLVVDGGGTAAKDYGHCYLEFEVEFRNPQLQDSSLPARLPSYSTTTTAPAMLNKDVLVESLASSQSYFETTLSWLTQALESAAPRGGPSFFSSSKLADLPGLTTMYDLSTLARGWNIPRGVAAIGTLFSMLRVAPKMTSLAMAGSSDTDTFYDGIIGGTVYGDFYVLVKDGSTWVDPGWVVSLGAVTGPTALHPYRTTIDARYGHGDSLVNFEVVESDLGGATLDLELNLSVNLRNDSSYDLVLVPAIMGTLGVTDNQTYGVTINGSVADQLYKISGSWQAGSFADLPLLSITDSLVRAKLSTLALDASKEAQKQRIIRRHLDCQIESDMLSQRIRDRKLRSDGASAYVSVTDGKGVVVATSVRSGPKGSAAAPFTR